MTVSGLYDYTARRLQQGLNYIMPTVQWSGLRFSQAGLIAGPDKSVTNLYLYGMFEYRGEAVVHAAVIPGPKLKRFKHFAQALVYLACDFTRSDGGLSEPNEIRTFIVLGCSRSGTSLLSGILHESGVNMGHRFGGVDEINPVGFYENLDFADLNIQILKTLGIEHMATVPPEMVENATQMEIEIAAAIVKNASGDWGWKDPRTVILWPWYERCLCEMLHPHLIITHRGRDELLRSWLRTGQIKSRGQGEMLAYYFDLRLIEIEACTGYPTLHVQFEDWWDDLDEQVARLAEFTGHEINTGHFDPALRRANNKENE